MINLFIAAIFATLLWLIYVILFRIITNNDEEIELITKRLIYGRVIDYRHLSHYNMAVIQLDNEVECEFIDEERKFEDFFEDNYGMYVYVIYKLQMDGIFFVKPLKYLISVQENNYKRLGKY